MGIILAFIPMYSMGLTSTIMSLGGIAIAIGAYRARVQLGPDIRRGLAELDGKGEVAGGIVVMRYGENALRVIQRVKAKIGEIASALPKGVKVVTTYDRRGRSGPGSPDTA